MHLSGGAVSWRAMRTALAVACVPVRELQLHRASDRAIFHAERTASAVVMTKDVDFVALLDQLGPPPQVIWVTCGNTSNARLQRLVASTWPAIVPMLQRGEALIELSDGPVAA